MIENGLPINFFKMPLIWFFVFIALSEALTQLNSPAVHATQVAPPDHAHVYSFSQGPPAPVQVELPALQKMTSAIRSLPASPDGIVLPPNNSVERAVQFALAQVGKPYRWAAAGPGAFDCSGLVMTAFAQIGIKLPHFTGAMINYGRVVGRNALQRGDLVFPSAHHVAIYLGNNQIVEAPQPGQLIKINKMYAFYTGRRLV